MWGTGHLKQLSLLFPRIRPCCLFQFNFVTVSLLENGPGSSIGIATDNGLDGPASNPGWDEIFRPDLPWGSPSLLYNGYRVFPGVEAAGVGG